MDWIRSQKVVAIASALLVMSLCGCARKASAQPPDPVPSQARSAAQQSTRTPVPASGVVVPARLAKLSFQRDGSLEKLMVKPGDEISPGQLLASLDTTDLELALAQAEAALAVAEAELADVQAGTRQQKIDADQAAVAAAQASVKVAQSELVRAEANLAQVKAGPEPEKITAAKAEMEKAAAVVQQAQSEYDQIAFNPGAGGSPQAVTLQKATLDYEAAKANYETLLQKPTDDEITEAQAEVDEMKARVEAAKAEVDQAQANLALSKAGASETEIALMEAKVKETLIDVRRAQAALKKASIIAPFAGTVAQIFIREGEFVKAGSNVIMIADLSHLLVETTDLDELDIVTVKMGQPARVTFSALSGQEFWGKVTDIALIGRVEEDSTSYTVTIELEKQAPELRWGMTALIEILTD